MSERLEQLQRQQALIREQLSWIEAEIARERSENSTAVESIDAAEHDDRIRESHHARNSLATAESPSLSPPTDSWQPTETTLQRSARQLPPSMLSLSATPAGSTVVTAEAQALIDQYSADESNKRADARRGCFIIFAAALAMLILGIAAVWWFGYHKPA